MPKAKKRRFRKFQVPEYIKKALESLRPPEDITVSEWAEKYRILDGRSATPGPWRNNKTPYLVEIMDCLNDPDIEEIVFVKPAQVGGTECLLNMMGYIACQDPAPTMAVYPSDELGERVVTNRIRPMIYAAKPLLNRYRPNESSKSELFFDGMSIAIQGSNSPANLSSFAICNLFLDEVDKYPGASKKESDPISLARERTKTYRNRRKIFMISTPTLKTGHIWKSMEKADAVKHYFVPCPHCGKYIELVWKQIDFPSKEGMSYADRAEFAVYRCQECNGIITDRHKPQMLRNGEWRIVEQRTQFIRKVAYWINTLYSPFVRFSEMVKEFLMSKDDPDSFQNFTNSWWAEPWEDTKLKTNADLVLERQTQLQEFTIPSWAKLLTAGVDVQEQCVYWTIRAWDNYLTSQNIAHGQAASFAEIERIMNLQYVRDGDGDPLVVALALIDSGDNTDLVYDFCASNSEWALPSKGSSHPMDTHFRLSKVNKTDSKAYGMPLAIIDTGKYKDMIAGRLRKQVDEAGSWTVYAGCDREYAEQVTAEHKVNEKTQGGRITQKWVLKTAHGDNHYLDCEVYAMCAADMLGARTLHLEEVEMEPRKEAAPPPPEESWIGKNEGWFIGG